MCKTRPRKPYLTNRASQIFNAYMSRFPRDHVKLTFKHSHARETRPPLVVFLHSFMLFA